MATTTDPTQLLSALSLLDSEALPTAEQLASVFRLLGKNLSQEQIQGMEGE
jgi:hypothetical protein